MPSKTDSATSVKTSTPSTTASTTSTNVPVEKAKEPVSGSSGSSISVSSDTVPVDDKTSKIPSEVSLSTASKPIDSKLSSIKETSPQPTDSSKPYQELPNPSEVVDTNISPSASIPSSVGLPSGTFEVVGSDSVNDFEFSDSLLQGAPINAFPLTMNEKKDFGESNLDAGKLKDNFEDSDENVKDIAQSTLEDETSYSEFSQTGHQIELDNELVHNIESINNNNDLISETKSIASSLEENHSDNEEQSYEDNCKENIDEQRSDLEGKNMHLQKVSDNNLALKDTDSCEEAINLQDVTLNFESSKHQLKKEQELSSDDELELKENSQKTYETDKNAKIESDDETEYYKNNETFDENVANNYDTLQNTDNSSVSKFSLLEEEETIIHNSEQSDHFYGNDSEKVEIKKDSESIDIQGETVHDRPITLESESVEETSDLISPNFNNFNIIDDSFNKNNDTSSNNKDPVLDDKIEPSHFEIISSHCQSFDEDNEENFQRLENKVHEDSEMPSDEVNETFVSEGSLLTSSKTKEESAVENTCLIPPFSKETSDDFDDEKPFNNNEEITGFESFQSGFSKQDEIKRTPSETSLHSDVSNGEIPLEPSLQPDNPLDISTPKILLHDEDSSKKSPSETLLKVEESNEPKENIKIEPIVNESDFQTIDRENTTQQSIDISFKNDNYGTAKQGSSSSSSCESDNEEPQIPINYERDEPHQDENIEIRTPSETSIHSEDSNGRVPLEISSQIDNPLDISTPETLLHFENASNRTPSEETSLQTEELIENQENTKIEPSGNENNFLTIDGENTVKSIEISSINDNYETSKQSSSSSSSSSSSESDNEEPHIPINYERDEPLQENQNKDDPFIIPSKNSERLFSNDGIELRRENSNDENEILSSIRDNNLENNNNSNEAEEILSTSSNIQNTNSYSDEGIMIQENLLLSNKLNLSETEIKNNLQVSVDEIEVPVNEYDFSSNAREEDYSFHSSSDPIKSQEYDFEGNLMKSQDSPTDIALTETEENTLEKTPITHIVEEHYSSNDRDNDSNPFMSADSIKNSPQDDQMSTDITSLSIEASLSNSQEKLANEELSDYSVNSKSSDLSVQLSNPPGLLSESIKESKGVFSPDDDIFNTTTENITQSDNESDPNSVPELALLKKRVSFSLAPNSGDESKSESDSNSVHSFNDKNEIILRNESEDEIHEDINSYSHNADNMEAEILSSGDYPPYSPALKELDPENSEHFYGSSLYKENNIESEISQSVQSSLDHSDFSDLDVKETVQKNNEDKYFQQHFDNLSNQNTPHNDHPTSDNDFEPIQENVLREIISSEEKRESSSEDDEEFNPNRKESFETRKTPNEQLQLNTSLESSTNTKDVHLQSESDDDENDDRYSLTSANSQKFEEVSSKDHLQMNMFSENNEELKYDIHLQYENDKENEESNSFSSETSQLENATNKIYNETFESTISDESSHRNEGTEENIIFEDTEKNTEFHQNFDLCESYSESDPEIRSKDVVKRLFTSSENINKTYFQDDTLSDITRLETDTLYQTFPQVKVDNDNSSDIQDIAVKENLNEENLDSNKYTGFVISDGTNNFEAEDMSAMHQQLIFPNNYGEPNNLVDENHGANFHIDPSIGTNETLSEEFNYQEKFSDEEHFPSEDSARGSVKEQLIFEPSEFRSEDPNLFINAELKYDQRIIDTSDDLIHSNSIQSIGYTSMQDNQSFSSEHKNVNKDSNLNPFSNYSNENAVLENTNNDLTSFEGDLHSTPNFEYLKSHAANNNASESSNYFDNLNNGLHLQDHEYDSYESSESVINKNEESSSSSNQKNINERDFTKITTEETQ